MISDIGGNAAARPFIELRRRLCGRRALPSASSSASISQADFAVLVSRAGKLIYTDVFQPFRRVKVAFFAALMFSFPSYRRSSGVRCPGLAKEEGVPASGHDALLLHRRGVFLFIAMLGAEIPADLKAKLAGDAGSAASNTQFLMRSCGFSVPFCRSC
jgi:hypothetical protein